jgi:hypothetical protein
MFIKDEPMRCVGRTVSPPAGSIGSGTGSVDLIDIRENNHANKDNFLAAALSGAPGLLHAQLDFKVADRDVQVHSFASQGFLYSNQNNFLTMPTSNGSFAFTDGGVNVFNSYHGPLSSRRTSLPSECRSTWQRPREA